MNIRKLHRRSEEFKHLRSVRELACLINEPEHVLALQAAMPQYHEFPVRKKSGGFRDIEDPYPQLKGIQRRLNRFLQAVYFFHKTKAAYGFIIAVKRKNKRNIVTHAKRHLNADYLMNVDVKEYFHSVDKVKVRHLFSIPPFQFPARVCRLLGQLSCYKGRLPMGAPTSPVLTNFYAMELDRELDNYADENQMEFTRYVDDMSLSGPKPIEHSHLKEVKRILAKYSLILNDSKTKFYGPGEKKLVTGILVSDQLEISPDLLHDTRTEIGKLRTVMEVSKRHGRSDFGWVKEYRQKISGYLQFSEQVLGPNDPLLDTLYKEYRDALNPPDTAEPVSWRDLPYMF